MDALSLPENKLVSATQLPLCFDFMDDQYVRLGTICIPVTPNNVGLITIALNSLLIDFHTQAVNLNLWDAEFSQAVTADLLIAIKKLLHQISENEALVELFTRRYWLAFFVNVLNIYEHIHIIHTLALKNLAAHIKLPEF